MDITIIDSAEKLPEIKNQWNELSKHSCVSLFETYDYILLLWEHFGTHDDRLFIMVMRENGAVIAIAPFKIGLEKNHGIPARTIRFISDWHGDRPDIIVSVDTDKERVWLAIHDYLHNQFTQWDIAEFQEQDAASPVTQKRFLSRGSYFTSITQSAACYFISLETSWDDYFKELKKNVRRKYRRSFKLLSQLPEKVTFDHVTEPQAMQDALDRYMAIENTSWKKEAGVGVGRDVKHIRFYRALLSSLSKENCARISIMQTGDKDMAGLIQYKYNDVVYASQITFNPHFARCSPGVVLRGEIVKSLFDSSCVTFDMMGMYRAQPVFKSNWATQIKQTYRIQIYKKKFFLFPLIVIKLIKKKFFSDSLGIAQK